MFDHLTEAEIKERAELVGQALIEQNQNSIHEGASDPFWQTAKRARTEFGPDGVLAQVVVFKTTEEWDTFEKSKQWPVAESGFIGAYIDEDTAVEFCERVGVVDRQQQIKEGIRLMIKQAQQPWDMPTLIGVIFCGNDPHCPARVFWEAESLDWWDTEADTIPRLTTTADVEERLEELMLIGPLSFLAKHKLLTIDTRNPYCAGRNINLWFDACDEHNIQPLIFAESASALSYVEDRHQAKILMLPSL